MRALVIGGGFLGRAIARHLGASGSEVRVLTPHPPAGGDPHVSYLTGRVGLGLDLQELLEGADAVVDASNSLVPATVQAHPASTMGESLSGAVWLAEQCVAAGVGTLAHLSSGGTVYGRGEARHRHLESEALHPISAYGGLKAATELAMSSIVAGSGTRGLFLRVANAYGPGQNMQRPQGIIGVALAHHLRGVPTTILGADEITRDYVYIDDIAELVLAALSAGTTGPVNVGSGSGLTLREVLEVVGEVVGQPLQVVHAPARPFDVPHSVLDIGLARSLGWQPRTPILAGVRNTWEWLNDNPEVLEEQAVTEDRP